jgi:hypothetical protein
LDATVPKDSVFDILLNGLLKNISQMAREALVISAGLEARVTGSGRGVAKLRLDLAQVLGVPCPLE